MEVRWSALRACRPLPPGRFLVLISVRDWVEPTAIVRLEGLGQLKNPMASSGIEPARKICTEYKTTASVFYTTLFFETLFASINIYRATNKIRSETRVDFHVECPLRVSCFNTNYISQKISVDLPNITFHENPSRSWVIKRGKSERK
jgi:hypothetical protein